MHAKANIRIRGQAFVVTHDEETAEQLIKALRGYVFYGKPMRLNYAKTDSDLVAKLNGTFEESEKTKREARHKEIAAQRDIKSKRKLIDRLVRLKQQTQGGSGQANVQSLFSGMQAPVTEAYKILFVEKLPKTTRPEVLDELFGKYTGFIEVRQIPDKGVAFIEFLNEDFAAYSLNDI